MKLKITPEMVEAAFWATPGGYEGELDDVRAALAAAAPLIIEECAKVADDHAKAWGLAQSTPAVVIAAAIRDLAKD